MGLNMFGIGEQQPDECEICGEETFALTCDFYGRWLCMECYHEMMEEEMEDG